MRRRMIGLVGGALLAGALLLGGVSAALARGLTAAPSGGMMGSSSGRMMGNSSHVTTPYDLRFMDEMIMHHEGAIMSARMMISQSARPELRDLARRIISGQQAQVDQMWAWIWQWYPNGATRSTDRGGSMMSGSMMSSGMRSTMDSGSGGMMDSGSGEMMDSGSGGMMDGDTADRMFLRMMIPHHQIAIDMSRDALMHAQHPQLKELARSIIRDQSAQIIEMRGYLKAWYGETSTRDMMGAR